eukprot:6463469-Amphidinium_carterae.1
MVVPQNYTSESGLFTVTPNGGKASYDWCTGPLRSQVEDVQTQSRRQCARASFQTLSPQLPASTKLWMAVRSLREISLQASVL